MRLSGMAAFAQPVLQAVDRTAAGFEFHVLVGLEEDVKPSLDCEDDVTKALTFQSEGESSTVAFQPDRRAVECQ